MSDSDELLGKLGELLDSKLEPFRAQQREIESRLEEMESTRHADAPANVESPRIQRHGQSRPDQFGHTHIDPKTGAVFDAQMTAEMWRPYPTTCPCGEVSYVQTQKFTGEQDILEAQKPVVDEETGAVRLHPWRYAIHPDTGENLVPEELRLTPDKREHIVECSDANSRWGDLSDRDKKKAVQAAADDYQKVVGS